MTRLVPKNCIVHAIQLRGDGRAEIRFRCVRDGRMETGQHQYPIKGGGFSNYRSKVVKAGSVYFRGMNVYGQAHLGFQISPNSAVCHKEGREIRCKLEGPTAGLAGLRTRRRR